MHHRDQRLGDRDWIGEEGPRGQHAGEADREAAWTLVEDCFLEWSERDRMSLADFGARVWDRPGFDASEWAAVRVGSDAGDTTMAEAGVKDFEDYTWIGFSVPAGVLRFAATADRLNRVRALRGVAAPGVSRR